MDPPSTSTSPPPNPGILSSSPPNSPPRMTLERQSSRPKLANKPSPFSGNRAQQTLPLGLMAEVNHTVNVKGHYFVLYTYNSPTGCNHCHTSMWRYGNEEIKCKQTQAQICHRWSLQKVGYKCRECSIDLHLGCTQNFESPCEQGHFMKNVRKSLVKRTRTRSIDDYTQIVRPTAGFNLEDGLSGILQGTQELTAPAAMEETAWYSIHFVSGEHDHFVMSDKKHRFDPFMISIMREMMEEGGTWEGDDNAEELEGRETSDPQGSTTAGVAAMAIVESEGSGDEDVETEDKKKAEKKREKERKEKEKKEKKEKEKEKKLLKKLRKDREAEEETIYRVIVWKKSGKEQWTIPVRRNELLSGSEIADIVLPDKKGTLKMMEKSSPLFGTLAKELTMMEWEEYTNEFKFGVIYTGKGQSLDSEFFCNEHGSPAFYEFLDLIGEKVPLRGYQGYKGGLDTENGASGEHTYVSNYQHHKIMFHVSTLLPFSATDPQQIKRKRHIGNDVVAIIFQDTPGSCFSPRAMKSQLLHVFVAVCLEISPKGEKRYRVNVTSRDSVPPFGPALPDPPVFVNPKDLREFLLQKLVNAERSALFSESFQQKKERALSAHLSYIHSRYSTESTGKKTALNQKIGGERKSTKMLTLDLSFANPFSTGPKSARFADKSSNKLYQHDSASSSSLSSAASPPTKMRFFETASLKIKRPGNIPFDNQDTLKKPRPTMKRRGSAPALFISNPELLSTKEEVETEIKDL